MGEEQNVLWNKDKVLSELEGRLKSLEVCQSPCIALSCDVGL